MRPMPSRRVLAITESPTLAIEAAAKALTAKGENVVSFGAGEPDFATPEHIVDAAIEACRHAPYHHYTPGPGLPELRAAIAEKTRRDSGLDVPASQVLVTNGGKHALFNAFTSLIDDGDEVLLPAPYWVSYPEMISLCGGRTVALSTTAETGFKVTVEQLEAARTEATKALVFVSPSNPTGAVYSPEEVAAIGRWAVDAGIWVVADEIYEHLVYGDNIFSSLPVVVPEARERCIVVNGVAKSYAMTGWRVGWMIGPAEMVAAASSLQSHTTSNVGNVAQAAALTAVSGDLEAVATMREAFDRRRLTMTKMLNEIEGVSCVEPQGAFYCFPSFEDLLGRTIAGQKPSSSLELAALVLDRAKVAIVPGEAFGAPGYARFSYALSDDDLEEGLRRLGELLG